jgi:hypothetical protein
MNLDAVKRRSPVVTCLLGMDRDLFMFHPQRKSSPLSMPTIQGEELEPARQKAEAYGVKRIYIDDLREEFVRDFVFPMFRGNALYEGIYLLGTSIARPLIAKRQIEIAVECGADAVSHGATGKGNDQIRFEVGYYALKPDVKVIAPWREWDLSSRTKLIAYAEAAGIPVPESKRGVPCISPSFTVLSFWRFLSVLPFCPSQFSAEMIMSMSWGFGGSRSAKCEVWVPLQLGCDRPSH